MKYLVDLLVLRNGITNRLQDKEPENPPHIIKPIKCWYCLTLDLETMQRHIGVGLSIF
jgi:hypothetical protein